ncbi:MAG: DUF4340 domain-containing protein, partial [Desulfobacteraceae bacterium]|nr:DUF4340 domain-containing protein [Desulfobacteraceae bacterium]
TKINRLVITVKEGTPLELIKKDEHWVIEPKQYPADGIKIKNMVNAIADLSLTAMVSEAGSYDRYGLTPKEKTVVQAYSEGKVVRSVDVGKAAPTFQHTFVMIEGDPKVYHARGQIDHNFDQTVEALRDKKVFDVDKETIKEITFSKGDQSMTLVKKEIPKEEKKEEKKEAAGEAKEEPKAPAEPPQIEWQKPDGKAVDKAAVDRLLGGIARLDCDGYLADEDKAKLVNATYNIAFKTADNEYTLSVFAKQDEKEEKLPSSASANAYPFYLTKWRVEKFEKAINELLGIKEPEKKTPEPPKMPAKAEPIKADAKDKNKKTK